MRARKEESTMKYRRDHFHRSVRGMTMVIIVFFLLALMPILLVFAKWVSLHSRGTTQSRIHLKEYHAANGSFEVTRYFIQTTPSMNYWDPTNNFNTTLHLDTGTVVTVNMVNIGPP